MNFLCISNANAAKGKALKIMSRLKKQSVNSSHNYDWHTTHSVTEMQSLITTAAKSSISAVLLFGGDGTISGALPSLLENDLPLGIIPCGRGNDFARNLNLPLNEKEAFHYSDQPTIRLVDIPLANGVPFASVACLGFDARVNEIANKPKKFMNSQSVYIYAVLKAIKDFVPFEISVSSDNSIWQGSVMLAAIANGRCYGGGMMIAPQANLEDSLLNICIVQKTGKWTLLKEFPKIYNGRHLGHPDVTTLTASEITISSENEQNVFADGEKIAQLPLKCTIGKHRLKILQPLKLAKGGYYEN